MLSVTGGLFLPSLYLEGFFYTLCSRRAFSMFSVAEGFFYPLCSRRAFSTLSVAGGLFYAVCSRRAFLPSL